MIPSASAFVCVFLGLLFCCVRNGGASATGLPPSLLIASQRVQLVCTKVRPRCSAGENVCAEAADTPIPPANAIAMIAAFFIMGPSMWTSPQAVAGSMAHQNAMLLLGQQLPRHAAE